MVKELNILMRYHFYLTNRQRSKSLKIECYGKNMGIQELSPHTNGSIHWSAPFDTIYQTKNYRLVDLEFSSRASLVAQFLKSLPAMQETWVRSLGQEDPLEKEMASHSSILAWRIPWTEKPGRLQSMGSQRIRHD